MRNYTERTLNTAKLPWVQSLPIDHIVDAAGSANNDMLAGLKNANVLLHVRPTNAGVAKDAHIVAESQDDLQKSR